MFINAQFPECLAFGAVSSPEWMTTVVENQGGWSQANQIWSQCRHSFDISTAVRKLSDYQLVVEHFNEVRGRAHSFPFKDPMDSVVSSGRGVALYVSPGVYQLGKRYGSVNPFYRKITRPVTPVPMRNGSPMAAGTGPGQYQLDLTTGRLTIAPDQTRSVSSHTVGSSHTFTLASALAPNVVVGGYVFASGVSGTAAARLNATPLEVTAVSGAAVTVAASTSGLTATGGTLAVRAAPADLSWSGEFAVPVRYGADRLPGQIINSNGSELFVQATSIVLNEVRE